MTGRSRGTVSRHRRARARRRRPPAVRLEAGQRTEVAALWAAGPGVREGVALGLLAVCTVALVAAGL